MAGYVVKHKDGFLFVGPSNPRFGICGKAQGVGLGLGPSDPGLRSGKA